MIKEEHKKLIGDYRRFFVSYYDFARDCLGYKDLNDIHKDLCEFLQRRSLHFKLILMPRYTFKSTLCTIGFALWKLYKNPDDRILIYSDAATKAVGFLNSIKAHITGQVAHSKFREYCPGWETDPKGGKWSESQIIISARQTSRPEPSVDTGGIETSKVGFHYDTIIFDDIVSDKNITTRDQMDKVAECYKKSLSLLRPGGEVMLVGTRWHFGDLYGRIIDENERKQTFGIFLQKAEENGHYNFNNIGENSLTADFLDQQKREQGSYVYSCLYQNTPVDDATAVFKTQDFRFYGEIKNDDLYITGTCDPAGEGEDYTAITVVGTDNNVDLHILEVVNQHLQPSEIVQKIIDLHYKYRFKMFGLETNFYRGMLRQELERRMREEHTDSPQTFPLFGVHEFEASSRKGQNKDNRIRALQPYHERGALKFPGESFSLLKDGFAELAWQMIQYPKAPHDDILDSLAYHLPLVRKGGVVKTIAVPKNSPAWLEREALDDEIRRQRKIPRRFRRALEDLAFS